MSGRDRLADFQGQSQSPTQGQGYGQQQQYGQYDHGQQQHQSSQQYGQQQYQPSQQYDQQQYAQEPYDQYNQQQYAQEPYDQYDQQQYDQYDQYDQQQYDQQEYGQQQYDQQQYGQQHYGQQYDEQQYDQQNQYGQQQQRYVQQNQYDQQQQQLGQQNQYDQQQQFAQQQQDQYQQPQYPPPTRIEMGAVSSASDTNTFFNEVAAIQNDIISLEQNITQIEELHDVSLNSVSSEDHTVQRKLEQVTVDTTQLSNRIKKSIKDIELANLRLGTSPDIQLRRTQAVTLKDKFLKTLSRYQIAESDARTKYQSRMERQYKIVKPDATQAEIAQAIDSDSPQIFAQSVLQSTRYGDANRALREVQTRHDDIKKIEKTILELQQLFIDMETLVTDQGVVMDAAEQNTQQADAHLESGNQQVDTAIINARSARRKKWICLIIFLIIVLIVVLVVLKTTGVI